MVNSEGIVVIDRVELMRQADRAGVLAKRAPAVALSSEEVFLRYRGFDGRHWPVRDGRAFVTDSGLAAAKDWGVVSAYAAALPNCSDCEVVFLARQGGELDRSPIAEWSLLGFDVGCLESEWSHFSVILNEVIFGVHPELRKFADSLNEHLLFSTQEASLSLIVERNRVAAEGKDVEHIEQMETIAVFAHR